MQQQQGVRTTLSLQNPRPKTQQKYPDFSKKKTPGSQRTTGHDKDLKIFKERRTLVEVELMSGVIQTGVVIDSDKYTIKILTGGSAGERERTFFKHAIESFSPIVKKEA